MAARVPIAAKRDKSGGTAPTRMKWGLHQSRLRESRSALTSHAPDLTTDIVRAPPRIMPVGRAARPPHGIQLICESADASHLYRRKTGKKNRWALRNSRTGAPSRPKVSVGPRQCWSSFVPTSKNPVVPACAGRPYFEVLRSSLKISGNVVSPYSCCSSSAAHTGNLWPPYTWTAHKQEPDSRAQARCVRPASWHRSAGRRHNRSTLPLPAICGRAP